MTFNKIEKDYWETFDINQGTDKINGYPVIKISDTYSRPATVEDFESFLKQSFIKYFQSEVERWIKVFDYHCDMSDERHLTMRNVARTEIENLEAQIKELEK